MSTLRCTMLVGALLLDAAVASSGLTVSSRSAWAQAVSLAELEGAVIDVSAVHQEKMIGRDGQPLSRIRPRRLARAQAVAAVSACPGG